MMPVIKSLGDLKVALLPVASPFGSREFPIVPEAVPEEFQGASRLKSKCYVRRRGRRGRLELQKFFRGHLLRVL